MAGEDVLIVKDDFLRALNKSDLEQIKLISLPEVSRGVLTVSGNTVKAGDTLSGDSLSAIGFSPAGVHITDAEFVFSDVSTGCEYTCRMYLLSEQNQAPKNKMQAVGSYVSTYKDLSVFSSLPGYDPDGNDVEFIIVNYPDNGSVRLDAKSGKYEYVPSRGYTGDDRFVYVIADEYGAFSASREVKISVESVSESEIFSDMEDSGALAEAISLTREGIMSGSLVGNSLMFKPKAEVTRAEFVAMLMECSNTEAKDNVVRTQFYDDSDIPSCYKGAIASAYELGYVKGEVIDGALCFRPNEIITRAECAIIADRMLGVDSQSFIPVIADAEDCPEDALSAVNTLCGAYIMPVEDNGVKAHLNLTREYAARLLCNVKSFITLQQSS